MPAIDFLIERNALPATVQRPTSHPPEPDSQATVGEPDTTLMVPDAAEGLDDLGTSFLE